MKVKSFIALLFVIVLLSVGFYFFLWPQIQSEAGFKVQSTPSSSIFLNDKLIGKTPYDGKFKPGEYVVKLLPEEDATQSSTWQGKIILSPYLVTFLNRELGSSELMSSGEVVYLQKNNSSDAEMEIISSPEASRIIIDGIDRGLTPALFSDFGEGEHDVAVSAVGFKGKNIRVQTRAGHKLTVNFQLAMSNEAVENEQLNQQEATKSAEVSNKTSDIEKPYVEILDTPTGFLRVREEASTNSSEVFQVKPQEKFPFLEEKNSWYKITYEKDKAGWVSSRYAKKVE